jgi:hypothetical protein
MTPAKTTAPKHLKIDKAVIDDIHALFDALVAFMDSGDWVQVNAYANKDAAGATTCGVNCTDKNGNSINYSERVVGPRVSINPPAVSLGPGGTQQFAATVTDATGAPIAGAGVTWAVTGTGTVSAAGLYTAPATITGNTSVAITATYAEGPATATATVSLHP